MCLRGLVPVCEDAIKAIFGDGREVVVCVVRREVPHGLEVTLRYLTAGLCFRPNLAWAQRHVVAARFRRRLLGHL